MQCFQFFCQVAAHPVRAILVGWREEADAIQVDGTSLAPSDSKPSKLIGARGCDFSGVFLPLSRIGDVNNRVSKVCSFITFKGEGKVTRPVVGCTHPEAGTVRLTLDNIDAPVADITRAIARLLQVEVHGSLLCAINEVLRRDAERGIADEPPVVGIRAIFFHGTVADELGIKPSVARVVNLLIEDTVVQRTYDGAALRRGDIEAYLRHSGKPEGEN